MHLLTGSKISKPLKALVSRMRYPAFFWKKMHPPLQKDAMIGFRQKVARWKAMDLSISEHPKNLKSTKGWRS